MRARRVNFFNCVRPKAIIQCGTCQLQLSDVIQLENHRKTHSEQGNNGEPGPSGKTRVGSAPTTAGGVALDWNGRELEGVQPNTFQHAEKLINMLDNERLEALRALALEGLGDQAGVEGGEETGQGECPPPAVVESNMERDEDDDDDGDEGVVVDPDGVEEEGVEAQGEDDDEGATTEVEEDSDQEMRYYLELNLTNQPKSVFMCDS